MRNGANVLIETQFYQIIYIFISIHSKLYTEMYSIFCKWVTLEKLHLFFIRLLQNNYNLGVYKKNIKRKSLNDEVKDKRSHKYSHIKKIKNI